MTKQGTSYRLSDTAKRLVRALSVRLGISQTAVIEMALRALARREGVDGK